MLAALAPTSFARDHELEDARESLAYWEARARTLPRHALRRRREAREMASRWQARVAEAERRLPQGVRRSGTVVARRLAHAAIAVCVCLVALFAAGLWAVVEVLATVLRALA